MRIEALTHVSLTVADLARAKAFYGGLLKLEELPRPNAPQAGAWYRIGTVLIHLTVRAQAEPRGARHFCLWVEDIAGTAAELAEAGYPVERAARKLPGVVSFYTRDPDGNRIEFQGPDGTTYAV